jgi:hypothetical protein
MVKGDNIQAENTTNFNSILTDGFDHQSVHNENPINGIKIHTKSSSKQIYFYSGTYL